MAEKFLSYGRTLRELGVDRPGLIALIRQGYLRAFKYHGRLVFRKVQVLELKRAWAEQVAQLAHIPIGPDTDSELDALGLELGMEPDSQMLDVLPEPTLHRRLGQILKSAGCVTDDIVQQALSIQRLRRQTESRNHRIGQILIEMGAVSETDVLNALSIQSGIPFVDLDREIIADEAVDAVPLAVAETYHIVPIRIDRESRAVVVATAEPQNFQLGDDLALLLGMSVRLVAAPPTAILAAMHRVYKRNSPKSLTPVRTPSGRLRVLNDERTDIIRHHAIEASAAIEQWLQEPADGSARDKSFGPRVFIAMPFHASFDPIAELIETAVGQLGGRSLRIDQVPNLRNIWLAIEREIARADVVVADFTGDVMKRIPNPNVVTEAAIAFHKYEKPVVVLTQSTEGLFFDWRHQFAVIYDTTPAGLTKLSRGLANRLAAEFGEVRHDTRKLRIPEPNEPI